MITVKKLSLGIAAAAAAGCAPGTVRTGQHAPGPGALFQAGKQHPPVSAEEGSGAAGCMYQISNQITLGITEEETLKKLKDAISQISESERKARSEVTGETLERLTDRIKRAEGTLRYAYRMSSAEFMKLFADVRFGIALGIVTDITYEQLGTLLVEAMPATLTLSSETAPKTESARDRLRAQKIQNILSPQS